jgi:hypothetical protein
MDSVHNVVAARAEKAEWLRLLVVSSDFFFFFFSFFLGNRSDKLLKQLIMSFVKFFIMDIKMIQWVCLFADFITNYLVSFLFMLVNSLVGGVKSMEIDVL